MNKRTFLCAALAGGVAGALRSQGLPRLRYGGDQDFAPFESNDPQGRARGFQIDLLAALGPLVGATFEITLKPWPDTEEDFRQGRVDVVGMVDTAARREWARFTRGHATPAFAVYHPAGRAAPQGLPDLAGLRIAVLDGDAMADTRKTWLAHLPGPFLAWPGAEQALAAVRRGDADVALLPHAYGDPQLAGAEGGGLVASHLNLGLQRYALAVAPAAAALQQRLQAGLDRLEQDGRLEALRIRWLSSHRDLAERGRLQRGLQVQRDWTWGLAGASALALSVLGAGLWRRGRRMAAERARRRQAEGALQATEGALHQAEDALRRAEDMLERTFTHHVDAMLVVERGGGRVLDANEALGGLLGVAPQSLIGRPLDSLQPHLDAQALQQLVDSLDEAGRLDAVPLRLRRAGGEPRDCLVSADVLPVGQDTRVFCIVRDVTESLAADARLREAYDEMAARLARAHAELAGARTGQARAESALHEFTRVVAHDLKTPLNAVQGFAGLLRQRLLEGHVQEAIGHAEHISRAAQRMTAMINALQKLAQVSRQPLQRQVVDMRRLAQETWALLAAAHPERRTDFRLDALPPAAADPDLVAQVWQNLLDNAAKYSARVAAPKVSVDCWRDERGTWYRVADNGAGFDMAGAQSLFLPFQRQHAPGQFEGSGVGLSLVRRIVDHHGGDIRVRSAPGVGTVAEFTLDPAPG